MTMLLESIMENTLTQISTKSIVDFAIRNAPYYLEEEREELERYCALHIQYGTMLVLKESGRIIAVCRWNVLPKGDTLHIIDLIIDKKHRSINMIRNIAIEIWKQNPKVRFFFYDRLKRGERKSYGYELTDWLKLEGDTRHGWKI